LSATIVVMERSLRYRSLLNFFGLNDEYIQAVYEEFFVLKYHGGWSFIEAYNLPIVIRRWFLERLVKEIKTEAEHAKKAAKG
jgi:hypothetical protein